MFILVAGMVILGCSTTDELLMSSLYSINDEVVENIRGDIHTSKLLIHKDVGLVREFYVTLNTITQGDIEASTIDVYYLGSGWVFIDEITLKINETIITVKDDNPVRNIRTGNRVNETLSCILDQSTIAQLKNCKELSLQYYDKPLTIPQEGIDAIKAFLK